ncbi:unnamed protein product [Ceratitis capitata]|uniref:(Mediterranean fruit fly) hypothetical protein n=1 Tax=Ceratitis capitata TaxID=7213 RepID=A0A811TZJ7_CERCA|nr:unnamed protein product [Ceratitis capitata]
MLGDPELKKCKKGDIIQLQRRGFFKVDVAYAPHSPFSNAVTPVILFSIPDGHTKDVPSSGLKINNNEIKNIAEQGTIVRDLKASKVAKEKIDSEVKKLLVLKAEYKAATGKEWKLGQSVPATSLSAAPSDVGVINANIVKQGDLIRNLKAKKAPKAEIDQQVKTLLELKTQFKASTGKDWQPNTEVPSINPPVNSLSSADTAVEEILNKITNQGDKVRQLKSQKADKTFVEAEVKILLSLKAEYKKLTGSDWKPGAITPAIVKKEISPEQPSPRIVSDLLTKISSQGDKVRQLKNTKAEKSVIDAEIKLLLALKTDYKNLTGQEWKLGTVIPPTATIETVKIDLTNNESSDICSLLNQISYQGDKIRNLKKEKASKATIDIEVQTLLALKANYKQQTGNDWTPNSKIEPRKVSSVEIVSEIMSASPVKELLTKEINDQGDKVRAAKSDNLSKEKIDEEVQKLLTLKAKYKEVTGTDFPNAGGRVSAKSSKKGNEKKVVRIRRKMLRTKKKLAYLKVE